MSKDELKNYIKNLQLPEQLEKLLLETVDNATEVTQDLLTTISDVLELQADFYDQEADILDEEADQYEDLSEQLELLDEEEVVERAQVFKTSQEQLLAEINQKVQELQTGTANASQVTNIQEELQDLNKPTE
jgi:uncharacterized NAD(P)/FAD-binding protein YdhS